MRIGGALTALLALFLIYRWTLTALSARTALGPGLDVTVALIAAAALAALTVFVTFRLGRRAALRRFFTGPARLTAEGLEIDGRPEESRNGELIRSEIAFADIDSLEYYPRLGCVRIGAPVCMTKFRDGAVVGTKYENSPERAFLTCFLVYIDNELFMRELSRRSGVPVETVSAGRPDADGTRF